MVRLIRTCAALALLSTPAALLAPASASAAPGLSTPYVVARGVSCVGLAGDTIAWEESRGLEETPRAARIATLGPQGAVSTTTAPPPGPGSLFCNPAASASSGAEVYSLPVGRHPHDVPIHPAPLWLARPGAPAQALGVTGIEPTVALAPDGSGVVAWLAEAGPKPLPSYEGEEPRTGPGFLVKAARLQLDGHLEAPQTLSGPSAGYEAVPEDEFPRGPVAQAAPDGSLAVAWALLGGTTRSEVVQVAEAAPGASFAAPTTLLGALSPRRDSLPENQLQLVAAGGRLFAQWQVGFEHLIESASRPAPGEPFVATPALPSLGSEPPELVATAADASGNTLTLLDSRSGTAEGALAVARRTAAGGARLETILPRGSEAEVPSLAVAPDGSAAVAWVQPATARDGSRTERAVIALAPPGGPFAAPAPLTGLAPRAGRPSVSFDAAGLLHVVWESSTPNSILSGTVFAATAVTGAPDPLVSPGPKIALRGGRLVGADVLVTVRVDRPCFVRVQALPVPFQRRRSNGVPPPGFGTGGYAGHAGTIRLRVPLPAAYGPARIARGATIRFVTFASSPTGASSRSSRLLRLPTRGPRTKATRTRAA